MEKVRARVQWGVQGCGWSPANHRDYSQSHSSKHFSFSSLCESFGNRVSSSQRWSWEEAPSRHLVRRKALNSGKESAPCNIHYKQFLLKRGLLKSKTPRVISGSQHNKFLNFVWCFWASKDEPLNFDAWLYFCGKWMLFLDRKCAV